MAKIDLQGSLSLSSVNMKKYNSVITPTLTLERKNNKWVFNLNGLNNSMDTSVQNKNKIFIQFVVKKSNSVNKDLGIRTRSKIKYPNFIAVADPSIGVPSHKKARFNITHFRKKSFTEMDLTNWVNDMLKWNSLLIPRAYTIRHNTEVTLQNNFTTPTGYWFCDIAFCVLVANQIYAQTNFIRVNMYNKGNINNINNNYTLINNEINMYTYN